MKKLLVVLLSLGLIVAFSTAASAVDVKFGGSYYLVGVYESNPALRGSDYAYSHAFFYQRYRLQPVFVIAEGLSTTFRFDAMEKQWGNNNWGGAVDDNPQTNPQVPVAKPPRGEQANFEFERGWVTFTTGIGMFLVGYQNVDDWGTDYGDYSNTRPRIQFATKFGPVTLALTYEKLFESDTAGPNVAAAYNTTTGYPYYTNADNDTYAISATYNGKGFEAGLLYKYYLLNTLANNAGTGAGLNVDRPHGISQTRNLLSPYMKGTFGPLYIEGEAQYWFGKYAQYEAPIAGVQDVDLSAWGAYVKGKYQFGPAYVGALFSYASGDDFGDKTKNTINPGGAGTNFQPALILLNDALRAWTLRDSLAASGTAFVSNGVGAAIGANAPTSNKYNSLIYSAFVGVDPTPKLNVEANLIYATVDKTQLSATTEAVDKKLGTEIDIKATYKIYDNLTYMVGAGYLWAGDYWKGTNANAQIDNNYILQNQLTLSF